MCLKASRSLNWTNEFLSLSWTVVRIEKKIRSLIFWENLQLKFFFRDLLSFRSPVAFIRNFQIFLDFSEDFEIWKVLKSNLSVCYTYLKAGRVQDSSGVCEKLPEFFGFFLKSLFFFAVIGKASQLHRQLKKLGIFDSGLSRLTLGTFINYVQPVSKFMTYKHPWHHMLPWLQLGQPFSNKNQFKFQSLLKYMNVFLKKNMYITMNISGVAVVW